MAWAARNLLAARLDIQAYMLVFTRPTMQIIYENDTQAPDGGYGFLVITELPDDLGETAGLVFSLQRSSDSAYLGQDGWVNLKEFVQPDAVLALPDRLSLRLGPGVVDNLAMDLAYRVGLKNAAGLEFPGILMITDKDRGIVYSGSSVAALDKAEAAPKAEPEPARPETPPAQPALGGFTITPPPPPPAAPIEPAVQPARRSNLTIILVLAVLAAIALIIVLVLVLSGDKQPPTPVVETLCGLPVTGPPLQMARQHLSGPADPEVSVCLARGLAGRDNGPDAAFLLYEDAASKGHSGAMLGLAAFYDPLDKTPSGSIQKDAFMAREWYERAEAAGETQAKEKLTALDQWAEKEKEGAGQQ